MGLKFLKFFDPDGKEITGTAEEILQKMDELMRDDSKRVVKQETIGSFKVSTVWIWSDVMFQFDGREKPFIYETIVFSKKGEIDFQDRYASRAEAEQGHAKAVARLEKKYGYGKN